MNFSAKCESSNLNSVCKYVECEISTACKRNFTNTPVFINNFDYTEVWPYYICFVDIHALFHCVVENVINNSCCTQIYATQGLGVCIRDMLIQGLGLRIRDIYHIYPACNLTRTTLNIFKKEYISIWWLMTEWNTIWLLS